MKYNSYYHIKIETRIMPVLLNLHEHFAIIIIDCSKAINHISLDFRTNPGQAFFWLNFPPFYHTFYHLFYWRFLCFSSTAWAHFFKEKKIGILWRVLVYRRSHRLHVFSRALRRFHVFPDTGCPFSGAQRHRTFFEMLIGSLF